MYLKRIELAGFKSFPEHTEVILSSGITAVVGPNGCGKSNLMDAVRWVLGEQRPRVLRGGKMEEVIFGGTPQRPAMSAAEITLVVDNESGRLPTEYTEVSISRRLDRSGDSEYRLNGQVCRLKDFSNLFLDTGMGSHGYAVIQAGMIDAIISEHPDERRFLFEEAAGVSKYKVRQREALRKMEATDQDLLRLSDLRNEVQTRVRSLARQKGMAERHRRLREMWKTLDIARAARAYQKFVNERDRLAASFESAVGDAAALTAQTDALELERQKLRLSVDEAERDAQEIIDRLTAATAMAQDVRAQRLRSEDRIVHLREEQTRAADRSGMLVRRSEEATQALQNAQHRRMDAEKDRERVSSSVNEAEQSCRAADQAFDTASQQERTARERRDLAERDYVRAVSQREAMERHAQTLASMQTEQRERLIRLEEDVSQLQLETAADAAQLSAAEEELRRDGDAAEQLQKQQREIQDAIARTETEIQQRRERLDEARDGRAFVEGLMRRGEGLGEAAERILSDEARWGQRVSGWVDRLHPKSEWMLAIETVLADRIAAICCVDQATVHDVVAHLLAESTGRAVVLDPSLLSKTSGEKSAESAAHFVGWLSDFIDCEPADAGMVNAIFGGIACVDQSEDVRPLFESLGHNTPVVSRDGLHIAPPGTIRVGRFEGEPVVGRRARLQVLDARMAESESVLEDCRHRLAELERTRETLTRDLTEASSRRNHRQHVVIELRAKSETVNARLAMTRQSLAELRQSVGGDPVTAREDGVAADDRSLEELQSIRDTMLKELEAASNRARATEEHRNRQSAALSRARIAVVEAQARLEAIIAEQRRYTDQMTELNSEQQELSGRLAAIQSESSALEHSLNEGREHERQSQRAVEELEEQRRAARAELSVRREAHDAQEAQLRESRRRRDEAERARSGIELQRAKLDAEAEQWRRHVRDTHQMDLATATVARAELSDEDLDKKVQDAQCAIDKLGPVNPLALEEWERESERLQYLDQQIRDLQEAKKSLVDTITELNETAGRRFTETFETARGHFQVVFNELFRGGEADVRLTQPDQPLESPIEIYARPRGKKFIGIRQLSGGERALTALALLFALYLVKPSPFCILDEVDAPLDDANCGRFLRLLHRFKQSTQFIVVTHNKLTMDAADVLYGVTMEQPGVSKLVSVRLNRGAEQGGNGHSPSDDSRTVDELLAPSGAPSSN